MSTQSTASGQSVAYVYDAWNRVAQLTVNGETVSYTYDSYGNLSTHTDPLSRVTTFHYDAVQRVTKTTDAGGDVTVAYDGYGNRTRITDSLNHDTTYGFDITNGGRLTKATDAIGKETRYFYDGYGRQTKVGAGSGGTVDPTEYFFDGDQRLTKTSYTSSAGTHDAFYHYDDHDRLTKLGDWIDNTDGLQYGYDAYGRLTRLIDYDGSDLNYTYDTQGRVVSMNDYHGNTTTYGYDAIGRFTSLTAPGSKTWSYAYDGYGRLTRVDIPNGMHTEYGYDGEGRQTSIHHKDGATLKQGFDYEFATGGNITRIDHEDGSFWEYEYDGRDQLTKAERGNTASPTILAVNEYAYDAAGNMVTKEVPWYDDFQDGNITGWSGHTTYYSVSGGVLKNTSNASWRDLYLSESDADHDLRFSHVRYTSTGAAQIILRYTDNNNNLYLEFNPTNIHLRQRDGGTLTTLDTVSTTVAEDVVYQVRVVLDGANVSVFWGAEGASFDEILSTTSATELSTTRAAYFRCGPNSEHGFDDVTLIAGTRSTVETFTHNNANEQLTHTKNGITTDMEYDAWGRLTKRDDGTHEATYAYRYGSKLYSVASDFPGEGNVTYETGGDGKRRSRVAGVEETWYNWGKGWAKISEEVGSDGVGDLLTSWIAGDAGAVLGDSPATGIYSFTTRDSLGSSRGMWNASGENISKTEYDPYGNIYNLHTTSSLDDSHRFANVTKEGPTQLLYAPFRLYNPDTGRWLSRDPLGMVDGPNVYVYALSNPVSYKDSLGLSVIYDLGQDSEPGDKMKELLECISKALGVDIVVNGGHRTPKSKHYRGGSNHNNGNAADIRGKEGDPSSCDVSGAARKCAEDSGLTGFRACRRISTGHTHIDFGSEKTTDCSKWKDKKGNVLYEECCKD